MTPRFGIVTPRGVVNVESPPLVLPEPIIVQRNVPAGKFSKGIKLVLLGDAGVGKSSLVFWLQHQTFDTTLPVTLGCSFYVYRHKIFDSNDELTYAIEDTAGQERYDALVPLYVRGCEIVIVMYDRTSRDSFQHLVDKWIPMALQNTFLSIPFIIMVENKADLDNVQPAVSIDASRYCIDTGYYHRTISCKDGFGITEMFDTITEMFRHRIVEVPLPPEHKRRCC